MTARTRSLWRMVVIVFGLLMLAVSPVAAAPSPHAAKDVLTKPVDALTAADFERFMRLIYEDDALTADEVLAFFDRLGPEQRDVLFAVGDAYLEERFADDVAAMRAEAQERAVPEIAPAGGVSLQAYKWIEPIENSGLDGNFYSLGRPHDWYYSYNDCGPEPDRDVVFFWPTNATNPHIFNWATGDPQFLSAVFLATKGSMNLNGFGFPDYGLVYLCVGELTAAAGGGPLGLMATLYLGHDTAP